MKPLQNKYEVCERAAEALVGAGFVLNYISQKSEARYYRWPNREDVLRLAAHKPVKERNGAPPRCLQTDVQRQSPHLTKRNADFGRKNREWGVVRYRPVFPEFETRREPAMNVPRHMNRTTRQHTQYGVVSREAVAKRRVNGKAHRSRRTPGVSRLPQPDSHSSAWPASRNSPRSTGMALLPPLPGLRATWPARRFLRSVVSAIFP